MIARPAVFGRADLPRLGGILAEARVASEMRPGTLLPLCASGRSARTRKGGRTRASQPCFQSQEPCLLRDRVPERARGGASAQGRDHAGQDA
jgi:hypothetical protein